MQELAEALVGFLKNLNKKIESCKITVILCGQSKVFMRYFFL